MILTTNQYILFKKGSFKYSIKTELLLRICLLILILEIFHFSQGYREKHPQEV